MRVLLLDHVALLYRVTTTSVAVARRRDKSNLKSDGAANLASVRLLRVSELPVSLRRFGQALFAKSDGKGTFVPNSVGLLAKWAKSLAAHRRSISWFGVSRGRRFAQVCSEGTRE